jgi:flagellar biogenesis protein FliO
VKTAPGKPATRSTGFQPVLTVHRVERSGGPRTGNWPLHGLEARATRRLLIAAVSLLMLATSASADAPLPHTPLGDEPIRSTTPPPSTSGAAVNVPVAPSMDYGRVLGALGVVIALIFLLRWAAKFFFPSVAGRSPSHIVEVLARSMLTPKQHVVLIRVGRRLIVVGDSGAQMNTLCEIADPDEVASLVGQLRDEKISAASGFGSLFGRFSRRFDASEEPDTPPLRDAEDPPADSEASARSELDGLRDRVRLLAEQFK